MCCTPVGRLSSLGAMSEWLLAAGVHRGAKALREAAMWSPDDGSPRPRLLEKCAAPLAGSETETPWSRLRHIYSSIQIAAGATRHVAAADFVRVWKDIRSNPVITVSYTHLTLPTILRV